MGTKPIILLLMGVGSAVGSYIPTLWGDNALFSFSGIFFSAVGAIVGIYIGFRISED